MSILVVNSKTYYNIAMREKSYFLVRTFRIFKFEIVIPPIFKSICKSIIWLGFNVCSGLLPFLILVFIGTAFNQAVTASKSEFHHLLNDLVILFFCTSILGEITIEALLSKIKFSKYSYFGFTSAFFLVLAAVCLMYVMLIYGKIQIDEPSKSAILLNIQLGIIVFTVLYSTFIKTILFLSEDKNYLNE